ncbi:hypothetical protein [Hymenobacter sp.]|uniref:hypothetical protein n=1 Tax=Hymenobacter sp. TaxID=1898978 RepID=UPI00286CD69B|nr:hypothetical protein [Hymenobacter sp.]
MKHSLRFLLVFAVWAAIGSRSAQGQCPRSVQSKCTRSTSSCTRAAQPRPEHVVAAAPAPRRPALFRLAAGSSLNGAGDYPVLKTSVEYAPQFGRHWRLGSRLAYIGGAQPYDFGEGNVVPQSYRALNLEQEVYWLPFGLNKTVEFSLGAGAFVGYAEQKGWSQGGFNMPEPNGNLVFNYTPANERGFGVGYIASLSVECALNEARTWRVGGGWPCKTIPAPTSCPAANFSSAARFNTAAACEKGQNAGGVEVRRVERQSSSTRLLSYFRPPSNARTSYNSTH